MVRGRFPSNVLVTDTHLASSRRDMCDEMFTSGGRLAVHGRGSRCDDWEETGMMLATGYRRLPGEDVSKVLGVISIKDVLWAITEPSSV